MNRSQRHRSMGVRQYSTNGNGVGLKNRNNTKITTNYTHSSKQRAKSIAHTARLQDIERLRQAQKEEARQRQKMQMIETQKQIEAQCDDHKVSETIYENSSASKPQKVRKLKKKITYKLNGEKFVIYDYYKPTKILGKGSYAVVMYVSICIQSAMFKSSFF